MRAVNDCFCDISVALVIFTCRSSYRLIKIGAAGGGGGSGGRGGMGEGGAGGRGRGGEGAIT